MRDIITSESEMGWGLKRIYLIFSRELDTFIFNELNLEAKNGC
jgi:hypothetical protein